MQTRSPSTRPGTIAAVLGALALSTACAGFADHQSARLVGPGNVEITPAASLTWGTGEDADAPTPGSNHVGLRAAFGLTPAIDLRAGAEWVTPPQGDRSIYVLGAGPKIGLVPDRLAVDIPVGTAFGEGLEPSELWQVHPTVLVTLPVSLDVDLTPSFKAMIPLQETDEEILYVANLGLGWSPFRSDWTIRPEVGLILEPEAWSEGRAWHLSFGFSRLIRR